MSWGTLGGERFRRARVRIPGVGIWTAEVEMEGAPSLSGSVALVLGELELRGTIDESASGTSAQVATYSVVAGAGGWSRQLSARGYHSDSGIRGSTVVSDAAREVGERMGAIEGPASGMIGTDYIRDAGPASIALSTLAAGVPWWVDADGVTHIAARTESDAAPDSYEVLEVSAHEQLVTLAVDDLRAIGIGSVISERLDAPWTVRSMEIDVSDVGAVTVRAWCAPPAASASRLTSTLRRVIDQVRTDRLLGVWVYQVVRQGSDGRVEVRPSEPSLGLPELGPISVWPGIAGASCTVSPGAEVLVEFLNGDRRRPIARAYAPRGGSGHVPSEVVLAASSTVQLASRDATDHAARASRTNAALDAIAGALDALCSVPPIPSDGGAALQAAVRAAWAPTQPGAGGSPPVVTPDADVACPEVRIP